MIDRSLFTLDRLFDALIDSMSGNVNQWIRLVEIVPDYVPPFPRPETRPSIAVRVLTRPDEPAPGPGISTSRYSYLRTGGMVGWRCGGYFWDLYGTEFSTLECALLAVVHAPVPPGLLKPICWTRTAEGQHADEAVRR